MTPDTKNYWLYTFAGRAMQGLLARPDTHVLSDVVTSQGTDAGKTWEQIYSDRAVKYAKALLKELEG